MLFRSEAGQGCPPRAIAMFPNMMNMSMIDSLWWTYIDDLNKGSIGKMKSHFQTSFLFQKFLFKNLSFFNKDFRDTIFHEGNYLGGVLVLRALILTINFINKICVIFYKNYAIKIVFVKCFQCNNFYDTYPIY